MSDPDIQLITAATADYAWLPAFAASLRQHCNVPYRVWEVGRDVPLPGTPNQMLQHGKFLEYTTMIPGDPVLLFVDADMIMQRPLAADELALFAGLGADEICVGMNGARGQTLRHEAESLSPKVEEFLVDALFPGWAELKSWNTGFVAARRSAYLRLYDMTRALLPLGENCFAHYAVVQFVMSYALGRWLKHVELPPIIHLHGCWGEPAGFSWGDNGEALWCDRLVAFRHAINLNPPKCVKWAGPTSLC
jgi:hypothetical protein